MNAQALLRTLLPGLLPLVAYVAAESFFGEMVGLAVGLAVGVVEFAWTLIRQRRADPFVAADTALLALAGGLSLALNDPLFFKLKPAIIELVLGGAMGLFLVLPLSFLKSYMGHQLKGIEIPDSTLPSMRKSLSLMLGVLLVHAGLTVWAAFFLSTQVWGFISGGLFYILFALVAALPLAATWFRKRRLRAIAEGEELLPLVDETGKVIGVERRSECHKGRGKLHPVVHLQISNGTGGIYLQKRAADKLVQPGKWDTAVGGHVVSGEDLPKALSRELFEELGVSSSHVGPKPQALLRYRWDSDIESELVFVFGMTYAGPFAPDSREVAESRFWRIEDIRANMGKGIFTPNFEHEFRLLEAAAMPGGATMTGSA